MLQVIGASLSEPHTSLVPRPRGNEASPTLASLHCAVRVASYPVPRPAFRRSQYLPYCKRRKAGRGTGNEATVRVYVCLDLAITVNFKSANFTSNSNELCLHLLDARKS